MGVTLVRPDAVGADADALVPKAKWEFESAVDFGVKDVCFGYVEHAASDRGHEVQGAHQRNPVEQRAVKMVDEVGLDPGAGGVVGGVERLKARGRIAQEQLVGTAKEAVLDESDRVEFFGEKGSGTGVPVGGAPEAGLANVARVEAE